MCCRSPFTRARAPSNAVTRYILILSRLGRAYRARPVAPVRLCGTCRPGQDLEHTVRYVAPIFQIIVFYAAGAALFFAVSHVR